MAKMLGSQMMRSFGLTRVETEAIGRPTLRSAERPSMFLSGMVESLNAGRPVGLPPMITCLFPVFWWVKNSGMPFLAWKTAMGCYTYLKFEFWHFWDKVDRLDAMTVF